MQKYEKTRIQMYEKKQAYKCMKKKQAYKCMTKTCIQTHTNV